LNTSVAVDLIGTISSTSFTHISQPLGGGTIPFPIVYFVILHGGYIQMAFFFKTPIQESKKWDFIVLKLWTFISSSNQAFLEHARIIFYIF
jgi:hypothetical protein